MAGNPLILKRLPWLPSVATDTRARVPIMTNGSALEVPPPGDGLKTVTVAVPAGAKSLAGIVAASCVPLPKLVARSLPFQRTTEPETKFVPFAVSVNSAPPATSLAGASALSVGEGLLTEKLCSPELPPPGAGLKTVTVTVPPVAMSLAGMEAVSCMLLTKVVARSLPFQRTTEPAMKPLPRTVTVNAAAPAVALAGESELIPGAGLLTVKLTGPEVPPPGAGL